MRIRVVLLVALLAGACKFDGGSSVGDAGNTGGIDADSDADVIDSSAANSRRRVITILAPALAVADVVVPVRLVADADFAEHVGDGSDLLFQLPNGERLAHDIERFIPTSGELVAWVRVPLITEGDTIEMFYGDGNVATAIPSAKVWESLADWVLHFEDESDPIPDHSGSGFTVTREVGTQVALVSGIVGDAVDLNQVALLLAAGTSIDRSTESFSFSLWFDQTSTVAASDFAFFKNGFAGPGYQITLGTGAWNVNISDDQGNLRQSSFGEEPSFRDAGYVQLLFVVDRVAGELRSYTNGTLNADAITPLQGGFGSVSSSGVRATIGGTGLPVNGFFDEVRAYPNALDDAWIALDHQLTRDPNVVSVGDATAVVYPLD